MIVSRFTAALAGLAVPGNLKNCVRRRCVLALEKRTAQGSAARFCHIDVGWGGSKQPTGGAPRRGWQPQVLLQRRGAKCGPPLTAAGATALLPALPWAVAGRRREVCGASARCMWPIAACALVQ